MGPMRSVLFFIVLASCGFDDSVSYLIQLPNLNYISKYSQLSNGSQSEQLETYETPLEDDFDTDMKNVTEEKSDGKPGEIDRKPLSAKALYKISKARLAYYLSKGTRENTNCIDFPFLCAMDWAGKVSGTGFDGKVITEVIHKIAGNKRRTKKKNSEENH